MKKFALFILAAISTAHFTGCINDSSSGGSAQSQESSSVFDGISNVNSVNKQFSTIILRNGWTLEINSGTSVLVQRPSCSGFDAGDINGIFKDALVEYNMNPQDFVGKYGEATFIRVFDFDCVYSPSEAEEPDCGCPTNKTEEVESI